METDLYGGNLYSGDLYSPNTPYGVPQNTPTHPSTDPVYLVPRIPVPAIRPPDMMQPRFAGAGVLRRAAYPDNIYPIRQPVTQDTKTPTVGKDISLEELQRIQMKGETGGERSPYQALNTEKPGNTASGAYQVTNARWNNYGGYKSAMLAPKEIQDRWYAEDSMRRLARYQGDPFRMLADHYLPALANNPARWNESFRFKNGTVMPVSSYLKKVVKGTSLEKPLQVYLQSYGLQ